MDNMERTKLLMSGDKISEPVSSSPRSRSGFHMPPLRSTNSSIYQGGDILTSAPADESYDTNFKSVARQRSRETSLQMELHGLKISSSFYNLSAVVKSTKRFFECRSR